MSITHVLTFRDAPSSELSITFTNNAANISSWLSAHAFSSPRRALGLDTESRPVFVKGVASKVSVIQLSTARDVLVAHIGASLMPFAGAGDGLEPLRRLLCDAGTTLAGMSIGADVRSLCDELGVPRAALAAQLVELQSAAVAAGIALGGGLAGLANSLCGAPSWKSRKIQMSRWDIWPLSRAQILYAALDAAFGFICFSRLKPDHPDIVAVARASPLALTTATTLASVGSDSLVVGEEAEGGGFRPGSESPRKAKRCYSCHQTGHFRAVCPLALAKAPEGALCRGKRKAPHSSAVYHDIKAVSAVAPVTAVVVSAAAAGQMPQKRSRLDPPLLLLEHR